MTEPRITSRMTDRLLDYPRLLLVAVTAATAAAQCVVTWQRPSGFAVGGEVRVLLRWDPDGPGPRAEGILAAGEFTHAGGVPVGNIAFYDAQADSWSALAGGTDGPVWALAVLPNNHLVIGGSFNQVGGAPVGKLARWDGTGWHAIGGGVTGTIVERLLVTTTGDLLIGGTLTLVGGQQTRNVALWDGRAWSPIGNRLPLTSDWTTVRGLLQLPNGDILAEGMSTLGSEWLYRWTGTGWVIPSGTPAIPLGARTVATISTGALFTSVFGGALLHFDGTNWTLPPGPAASAQAIVELSNGDWIAASYTPSGGLISRRRNGVWQPLGTAGRDLSHLVNALLATPSTGAEDFVIGGKFGIVNSTLAQSIAHFRQGGWVGNPSLLFDNRIGCVGTSSTGDIVVGGDFSRVTGQVALLAARFDHATSTWQSTNGVAPPFTPTSVAAMDDGTIYASNRAVGVFRLSGNSWTSVLSASVRPERLIPTPDGRLLVIGTDLWIYDGQTWQTARCNEAPRSAAMLPNGDIVAVGRAVTFGVNSPVARWNGTAWSAIAPPNVIDDTVQAVMVEPSGEIVIGGLFLNPGRRVARVAGTTVLPIGAGLGALEEVRRLLYAPNGDIIAISRSQTPVVRWDGTSWLPVAGVPPTLYSVEDAAMHPNGELILVGDHTLLTPFFARQRASCPANTLSVAPGCTPAQGRLVATDWPHLGSTFRTRGSALPAAAFALVATGVNQANLPLDSLLPQGRPGCSLRVQPDLLTVVSVRGRTAEFAMAVPNSPPLVGALFRQQLLPLELDQLGQIVDLTATNSLGMQIGFAPR